MLAKDAKPLGMKERPQLLKALWAASASHSHWLPLSLKSHRAVQSGSGKCCTHSGFVSQLKNLKFRKPNNIRELLANLPNLGPWRSHYLYYPGKETNLLSALRESLPQSFSLFAMQTSSKCKHPWKDSLGQKLSLDTTENCHLNKLLNIIHYLEYFYGPGCSVKYIMYIMSFNSINSFKKQVLLFPFHK